MYRLIIGISSLTLINDVAQDVKYQIFDCVLRAGKITVTGSARLVEVFSGVWDGKCAQLHAITLVCALAFGLGSCF